ncbi:pilus assembly protein [Methylocaldum sp.]|uniref:pilus assembly protein n=1 Tax=Methylocaldum sp. TaxID=1969727 RepID=UPI002D5EF509|nr:PilC/PilY family type IV pilus protein [Methylocaldum sp.]HYE34437.1 PilC/PilY family type IV pilus protein [Methylocaldum sp.]
MFLFDHRSRKTGLLVGLFTIGLAVDRSAAAPLGLSDTPLFLTQSVTPNVILTLDDSLSMGRGYIPEDIDNSQAVLDGPRFTAASYNAMYYNPAITYPIPTRGDDTSYTTSFTAAYINGFDTSKGSTNLSTGYKPISQYYNNNQSSCTSHVTANANNYSSCLVANSPTTGESSTPYSYTCTATFDNRSGNDRLDVSGCGSPFNNIAAGESITVSNAGAGYNGTYSVTGVSNAGTRISVNENFAGDATKNSVTLTWTVTSSGTPVTAAFYHLYYTDKPGASKPAGCNDNEETDACYILIKVGDTTAGKEDIAGGGTWTQAQQQQNFAIWYSFYRTRALAIMSSAMTAVTTLASNQVRLAWQTLNACTSFGTSSCEGSDNVARENRMRTLDALKAGSTTVTHRTDFYDWLQRFTLSGSTPTRSALKRAGDYYMTSGLNSPYASEPYTTLGTELSCRKNFNILFTDGLWNSDSGFNAVGDKDSIAVILPDGISYSPQPPYKDVNVATASAYTNSNSLADLAFYYWATDLRSSAPGLANQVTPYYVDRSGTAAQQYWNPKNDPATWQHMVNFTIGLGLSSTLVSTCNYDPGTTPLTADPNNPSPGCPVWGGSTYAGTDGYAALAAGTKNWPKINSASTFGHEPDGHVYDLWHAAINSRGQFFAVEQPADLISAFKSAMASITNANPSAAALAANSTSIQTGTLLFQARFDTQDWHGQLIAYPVQGDGSVGTPYWDAATLIPDEASREIFTWDGSAGKTFTNCNSSLSATQKTALDTNAAGVIDNQCSSRLAWLRGDSSQEQRNGGVLRNRTVSVLGDIIDSDPAYTKAEDYGYDVPTSALAEKSSYASFVSGKSSRTPVVYVGANDGMLHAFRADSGNVASGKELFAYIPAGVYDNLTKLTDPAYTHKYFVDGAPSVGDAYFGGSWKTVLLGGLGPGGKSIYALDISNPDSFSGSGVLWEFSDAADLGLTFSQPQIARLNDGQWAAIFGNGYNSTSEMAFLYVVRLSDGALVKKIAAGSSTSNGLSTPVLYDADNDKIIDHVYAGDLQGNLWKFDLSAASSASWGVANSGNPLFAARNASNQVQPITAQPVIGAHPNGGAMVYFGTGQYLTSTDSSNTQVQTFYAIWDSDAAGTVSRSQLQSQAITAETTEFGFGQRETSNNTVDWGTQRGWYLDLVPPSGAAGERVISRALLKYDRIIFITLIPSSDPCVFGGESWLMELDTLTGSRTGTSAFDFNNDSKFDGEDVLASGHVSSGIKSTVGIGTTPLWLDSGVPGVGFKELSGTTGDIMSIKNRQPTATTAPQRIYWLQIL